MSYSLPASASFTLTGAPYTGGQSPDFVLDGKPLVYYAPPPDILKSTRAPWDTGQDSQQERRSYYQTSRIVEASLLQTSHPARVLDAARLGLFWNRVAIFDSQVEISHGTGQPLAGQQQVGWQQPPEKDDHLDSQWEDRIPHKDDSNGSGWNLPPERDSERRAVFFRVDDFANPTEHFSGYQQQPTLNFTFAGHHYTPATDPAAWFSFGTTTPNRAIHPVQSQRSATFASNRTQDEVVRLPWGFGRKAKDEDYQSGYGEPDAQTPPEPKPQPQQPDIRESYLLMNTINVVTLPDRTPIDLRNLDISLDIDSFSWRCSGELWGAASLALVEPDQNGAKQIEADINGWKWIFMVERYTGNRRFGQEHYTIHGTSRTQLLAAPYAPQRSKSSTSDLNAKQAISEELTNTGFTASYPNLNDYTTPDWIIPGGTFSYQHQTAMQVIVRLASTAGSVVVPSRAADSLNIQPRYPASPWAWDSATMDSIIPASLVISLSASWRPEPQYNAVYVSGTHTGVAVNVTRTGTPGDAPAPDILEDWLTATESNTERGRNELAKGGHQSITTLEIPLTDTSTAPGLIEPGQLVEVQDNTSGAIGNWRGLCLGTSIRAEGSRVTQSIELERHY